MAETRVSMTEKQWLKCSDAEKLNDFYGPRHTERKARLIMLAACRRHPSELQAEPIRAMVDLLIAHYADPRQPEKPFTGRHLTAPYRMLERYASSTDTGPSRGVAFGMVAAAEPVTTMKRLEEDFRYLVFSCLHDVAIGVEGDRRKKEAKQQAELFREVIGNPFRPVTLGPAWLTETVVLLARQMYESEDFSAMPILADALQDAGCEDDDVLKHCRNDSLTHVRGCWVLDLIFAGSLSHAAKPKAKRSPRAKKAKP